MEALSKAIDTYLAADTTRKIAAAKGRITKLINNLAFEFGAVAARNKILALLNSLDAPPRIAFLYERLTVGSLYKESDRWFGWWDDGSAQVQAEPLPFLACQVNALVVSFVVFKEEAVFWQNRGFYVAEPLPFCFDRQGFLFVEVPVAETERWAMLGWANPCKLQWLWVLGEYKVTRSIISCGFWQAWNWYGFSSRIWYLENRPELFADMDWWGEPPTPQRYEPENDPYAVVLGGLGDA